MDIADDDPRLAHWCRLGLLGVSALHWLVALILLWQHIAPKFRETPFSNFG